MKEFIIWFGMGFGSVSAGVLLGYLWWRIVRSVSDGIGGIHEDRH